MLLAGDELSHTQKGNNNTYCQDNELTWLNWELDDERQKFLAFVRKVTQISREQPVFQRRKFFQGRSIRGTGIKDISWFEPSGQEMSDEAWGAGYVKCLGVRLAGDRIGDVDERGEPISGDTLLVLINAHHEPIPFTLPATKPEHHWERLLDTADDGAGQEGWPGGQQYLLQARSLVLLSTRVREEAGQEVSASQAAQLRREARGQRVPEPTTGLPLTPVS
jgi:glycogen operon protein